ncbi:MAG: ribonuclease P protein component [Planctomycetota bacterium]
MKLYGLSKKERLSGGGDFEGLFKEGKVCGNKHLVIRYRTNQLSFSRLGIAISKKKVKAASRRNYLKRLVRESFRLNKHQLPKGLDIVVTIKKIDGITLNEIQTSLINLLSNLC